MNKSGAITCTYLNERSTWCSALAIFRPEALTKKQRSSGNPAAMYEKFASLRTLKIRVEPYAKILANAHVDGRDMRLYLQKSFFGVFQLINTSRC